MAEYGPWKGEIEIEAGLQGKSPKMAKILCVGQTLLYASWGTGNIKTIIAVSGL